METGLWLSRDGRRAWLADGLRSGALVKPFPGVYVDAARAHDMGLRLAAVMVWQPSSVIIGEACRAIRDPVDVGVIDIAVPHAVGERPWIRSHRIHVAEVLEVRGIRIAGPAWNACWLAGWDGGHGIDDYLRAGGRLRDIEEMLPHMPRSGVTRERKRVLGESRTQPWSRAERELHRLLHSGGITGWRANAPIRVGKRSVVGDVVFARERLCLEADGYAYHGDRLAFESDRLRASTLVAAGWRVQSFTWRQITQQPDWVLESVRGALRYTPVRI